MALNTEQNIWASPQASPAYSGQPTPQAENIPHNEGLWSPTSELEEGQRRRRRSYTSDEKAEGAGPGGKNLQNDGGLEQSGETWEGTSRAAHGSADHEEMLDGDTDDEETGLTTEAKKQRWKRRERNKSLDQRVAGDVLTAKEERKLADRNVLKRSAINVLLIGLWFVKPTSIAHVPLIPPGIHSRCRYPS